MSDTDDQQQTGDTSQADQADTGQQQGDQQQGSQDAGQQQTAGITWDGKVESLPDDVQRIIRDARKEAADNRVAKQAEVERRNAILKAAGIETDDEDPVKALETTRSERDQIAQELYDMRVERAVHAAAKAAGGDEDLVTAMLAHQGKLDGLDITADDFTSKLDALVKAAVDANPKLKATQAAAASGAEFTGGSGEQATDAGGMTVDDFRKARQKARSGAV